MLAKVSALKNVGKGLRLGFWLWDKDNAGNNS
jgi:hypothetical protein